MSDGLALRALRYAVPAARKPWVAIALRYPCCAQALGAALSLLRASPG